MILEKRLKIAIKTITELVGKINIISVNASISASRMSNFGTEGAAFKVIANEIQSISNKSLGDIAELGDVIGDVKFLSQTINKAGSLRMLSQKIIKQHFILDLNLVNNSEDILKDYNVSISKFEEVLCGLDECKLNTDGIVDSISFSKEKWQVFKDSMAKHDHVNCILQNDILLASLQKLVKEYEELAGEN